MTSMPTLSRAPFTAADPLLHPYFAGDDLAAEERLELLVRDEALPIVRGVVGMRLGRDGRDLEDICNEIVLQVVRRLRTARELGEGDPIASFRGYVATAAYRGCDAWLREKYPERHRLRNRVQYLVSHHPDFFLRAGEKRRWLCGVARDAYAPDRTARLRELDLRGIDWITEGSLKGEKLAATCKGLLQPIHGAVDLEVLVSILARGLDSSPATTAERDVADEREHISMTLEQQSHLRHLWQELCLLPRGQRVAVLLNLRGADGEEMLSFLPLIGIAAIAEIAQVLEMPAQKLAEMWNDLPWSDQRIADLLGITRQQVINLRKSGRERLLRRMRR